MKNEKHFIEVYNRGKGFNFRMIEESNLGKKIIFSTRQCYANMSECIKMAKKYCVANTEIVKLVKYYRIS
jgi:hypothetical protein